MKFEIIFNSKKSRARVGRIHTKHGIIDTPNFIPVATNGVLKGVDNIFAENLQIQLMFCNTYHLMIQPGIPLIKKMGGLHEFINTKLPLITDSGGFQVFSLAYGHISNELKGSGKKKIDSKVIGISEEGVCFKSYKDGSKLILTAENSIQAQKDLNADIIVSFDELIPYHIQKIELLKSFERTHRWEKRSLEVHLKSPNFQGMYAVVHGGTIFELRKKSCKFLGELDFDGFCIGGSLGKTKSEMYNMLKLCAPLLPSGRPIHLLGVGDLPSITECIPMGIDTFDSSYPTKLARHGKVLRFNGEHFNILNEQFALANRPLDVNCECYSCAHYSISYIRHLFKAHEIMATTLTSIHNLHVMMISLKVFREKILNNLI